METSPDSSLRGKSDIDALAILVKADPRLETKSHLSVGTPTPTPSASFSDSSERGLPNSHSFLSAASDGSSRHRATLGEVDPRKEFHSGILRLSERADFAENRELGDYLQEVTLFASLSDSERAKLAGALTLLHFKAGQAIIKQGDPADGFFIIKKGRARVEVQMATNEKRERDVIEAGDHFGEAALVKDAPRSASVIALEDCDVLKLEKKHFNTIFETDALKKAVFAKRKGVSTKHEEMFDSKQPVSERNCGKNEKQLKLIYEAIKGNVLFKGMAVKGVNKIISKMWRLEVPKGVSVIKQGEIGDNLYVIEKGKCKVYINAADGKSLKKLDSMKKGSCFGDVALLYGTPRNATVITASKTILWAVDRFTFRRVIRNINAIQMKQCENFLMHVPLLSALSASERSKIAEALDEKKFGVGEAVVKQAAEDDKLAPLADAMYIITSGTAKVTRFAKGILYEVKVLKPGDCFGELSLIRKTPRTATVTAITPLETLRLDAQAFALLMGPLETVLQHRLEKYDERDQFMQTNTPLPEEQMDDMGKMLLELGLDVLDDEEKSDKLYRSTLTPRSEARHNNPPSNALRGKVIDKEDLQTLGVLGKGSFGRVDLVRHRVTGQTYALKAVSKKILRKPKHQAHVMSEKNMLVKLDHQHIIALYATYKDSVNIYFLLEPCLGGELYHELKHHEFFENNVARFYVASVAVAFGYMHSKNIIYRDLKPENVLLDSMGYLKITDFGFATELDKDGRTHTTCGTPAYLAPEIIAGRGYGKGVDWWTLGVFTFELLSGYPPFRSKEHRGDMVKLYERITDGVYTCPPSFTPEAVSFIEALLQTKPTQRLGVIKGESQNVYAHPWFTGFDFPAMRERTLRAPIIPYIEDGKDLSNFNKFDVPTVDSRTLLPYNNEDGWDADF